MSFEKIVRDKLSEVAIKVNPLHLNYQTKTNEVFVKNLELIIESTINYTFDEVTKKDNLEKKRDELVGQISEKISDQNGATAGNKPELITITNLKNSLREGFRIIKTQNESFHGALLEISKMDREEKIRAFWLRIFTAIGLAAIILATSAIAQYLGIPLPLRMGAIITS